MQAVATLGAGVQASSYYRRNVELTLREAGEIGVGDIGIDLGLEIFRARELPGPLGEMIERRGALPGARPQREKAVQVVAHLFDREMLLPLFPKVGQSIGQCVQRGGGAGVIAAGQHRGTASKASSTMRNSPSPGDRSVSDCVAAVSPPRNFRSASWVSGDAPATTAGARTSRTAALSMGDAMGSVMPVVSRPMRAARLAMAVPAAPAGT